MGSFWAIVGLLLVPWGAALKYLVWNFFINVPQKLEEQFSPGLAEARASIHERKILPVLVQIVETVESRKRLVATASTAELLSELVTDARVKDVLAAVSEGAELDRLLQRACDLCPWVALPWLCFVVLSALVVAAHFQIPLYIRGVLLPFVLLATLVSFLLGAAVFGLFVRTKNKLLRLLAANRL